MEYFHNPLAESTNDESLAEGNYKLQYKLSDTASKAPWIGLETDEDADACQETVVNGYINNKRKKAPWILNVKMVTTSTTKRPGDSDVEEIIKDAAGKTKKRKVSCITLCVENSVANENKIDKVYDGSRARRGEGRSYLLPKKSKRPTAVPSTLGII
jgi:hypothetical protein